MSPTDTCVVSRCRRRDTLSLRSLTSGLAGPEHGGRNPQIGVSGVTYYRWRQEFGGLKTEQVQVLSGPIMVIGKATIANCSLSSG
jgi:hypothetical protein